MMTLHLRAVQDNREFHISLLGVEGIFSIPRGQELIINEDEQGIVTLAVKSICVPEEEAQELSVPQQESHVSESSALHTASSLSAVPAGHNEPEALIALPPQEQELLFQELIMFRRQIAREEGLPPYIIFQDKSLREMAQQLPQSKKAFYAISGVGKAKLDKYGHLFMDFIFRYYQQLAA